MPSLGLKRIVLATRRPDGFLVAFDLAADPAHPLSQFSKSSPGVLRIPPSLVEFLNTFGLGHCLKSGPVLLRWFWGSR